MLIISQMPGKHQRQKGVKRKSPPPQPIDVCSDSSDDEPVLPRIPSYRYK